MTELLVCLESFALVEERIRKKRRLFHLTICRSYDDCFTSLYVGTYEVDIFQRNSTSLYEYVRGGPLSA